jgi:hypothetical protein
MKWSVLPAAPLIMGAIANGVQSIEMTAGETCDPECFCIENK